jgi:hypothetical protein
MAKKELLESEHWRIFRLFLCDLSDEELGEIEEQLEKERVARRERENSIVRLFLSVTGHNFCPLSGQFFSH